MIYALTENGRLISLLVALVIVAGLGALYTLPIAEDPRMENRYGLVLTAYPGANAERVEALVTEKLELKLRELPQIKEITSSSGNGLSSISLALRDEITEPDLVWSKIRDQIAEVEPDLPAGSLPSRLLDERGFAYTMLIALRAKDASQVSPQILQRYARELQSQLRSLGGTDVVEIDGEVNEEILVNVSSAAAAAADQTVETIAYSLSRFDTKASAGTLENETSRLQVEVSGDLDSIDRVARIPLTGRGEGQVLRVADIARVSREVRSPDSEKVLRNGQEQLIVAARMLPQMRIARWQSSVTHLLDDFSTLLPSNIEMEVIFDQQSYTDQRMQHLVGNIAIGFVLILAILLVTLGWRSAVLVSLALPLMMLFTFSMMSFTGVPINQMSVTGLVVALGITVDNAIVMVDDIAQRRRMGKTATQAVREALAHLWLPLFGSTATTILAFLPIYLTPGGAGEFVGSLAICVVFSLIGSYLISHTVVAALAGRYVGAQTRVSVWSTGLQLPKLSLKFERTLRLALKYPWRTLGLVWLFPLAGFYGITTVPESFFPPVDRDMFSIEVTLATRTSFASTERTVREMDKVMAAKSGLESVDWFIGKSAAPFYYNLIERKFGAQNYAHAMVKTQSADKTTALIRELELELPLLFPEAQIIVRKLVQGPPVFQPVEVRLYGTDLAVLEELGEQLRLLISSVPNVTGTNASLGQAMPTVKFRLKEEIMADTAVSPLAAAASIRANLNGVIAGALLEDTEEVPVRVRIDAGERNEPLDLQSLNLMLNQPQPGEPFIPTPLMAVADMELSPNVVSIPHFNGRRVNTIGAYIRMGVLADTVVVDFRAALAASNFVLPVGYQMEIGGEAEDRSDTISSMAAQVPLIFVMLIVVLVLSFNSWRLCMLILTVAFMSVGLGMLSLAFTNFAFGFQVIIALLGLMGLAINGAIVILAELRSTPAALQGNSDGIVEAVMHCARHISSTTITTVAGFFPLLIGGGLFWPPFATTIAGGTVLVTLLSFFFVPAAFLLMTRRSQFEVPVVLGA
ncbi:MAG: multidrug efflux pump [Halioglobus sp.]